MYIDFILLQILCVLFCLCKERKGLIEMKTTNILGIRFMKLHVVFSDTKVAVYKHQTLKVHSTKIICGISYSLPGVLSLKWSLSRNCK